MNKLDVHTVLEYINRTVKRGGSGFYCAITENQAVLDVFHASMDKDGDFDFQLFGIVEVISPEHMADTLFDDKLVTDFVYLNDILLAQYRDIPDNM